MPKPKEKLFYCLFPDHPNSYVLVKALSGEQALENAQKQFPECDRVITEKQFDPKLLTDEVLRIKAENQGLDDDF